MAVSGLEFYSGDGYIYEELLELPKGFSSLDELKALLGDLSDNDRKAIEAHDWSQPLMMKELDAINPDFSRVLVKRSFRRIGKYDYTSMS